MECCCSADVVAPPIIDFYIKTTREPSRERFNPIIYCIPLSLAVKLVSCELASNKECLARVAIPWPLGRCMRKLKVSC